MSIKVLFFGQLRDEVQIDQLELTGVSSTKEVLEELQKRYPALDKRTFQIATNQELNSNKTLEDGDELALLPPFAGG